MAFCSASAEPARHSITTTASGWKLLAKLRVKTMADRLDTRDPMFMLSRGFGDPVLFLHGMPTSSLLWDGVIDGMLHQHTCISVDLPGLGRTPKTAYGFQKLDKLATSIENIRINRNIERWNIVGHDAGCAIAVHYSHQFQQRVG